MAGPWEQRVRPPAVAGTFYPADAGACRKEAAEYLQKARAAVLPRVAPAVGIGGIVPHAGWVCSAAIAAEAIALLAWQKPSADVIVVFGAIHTPVQIDRGVLDTFARWATPQGLSPVADLRAMLVSQANQFAVDDRFHATEHAVEVELPLIQQAWPDAAILPVEVPPNEDAVKLGETVAAKIAEAGLSEVYLASSDLTHYGPNYRFAPAGVGEGALNWAMENDRRLLQIVTEMTPQRIVPEARSHLNACGAGAIAAMMSASQARGARQAVVLRHQNSYQTLQSVMPRQGADNAVGYAAVWVG